MLGGPKIGWRPKHKIPKQTNESNEEMGTRNPRKSALTSKVVNPFTHALVPPFIGRQRDFYILRLPSNLENTRKTGVALSRHDM
jgi:hypothetical protein